MEAVSQVVLRNSAALPPGTLLLVNPPRDRLFQALQAENRTVRVSTPDYGDYEWLRSAGAETAFEAVPEAAFAAPTVIAVLPREKERLDMLLHAIASGMPDDGSLWLVGENRAGAKSSARHLERWFRTVNKRDSARHCQLIEAQSPNAPTHFALRDYESAWSPPCADNLTVISLPGVFAHGRLDPGTAQLLPVLQCLKPSGRVVDFACGGGVIGLCLLSQSPDADLTLLDNSALALHASQRALEQNRLQARILPSDGLSRLSGRYDWIVSNPPFHKGVHNTLEVAEKFFRDAGTFLDRNGRILVVFNRHLPYLGWLRERFERVDLLNDDTAYLVVCASRPR